MTISTEKKIKISPPATSMVNISVWWLPAGFLEDPGFCGGAFKIP